MHSGNYGNSIFIIIMKMRNKFSSIKILLSEWQYKKSFLIIGMQKYKTIFISIGNK